MKKLWLLLCLLPSLGFAHSFSDIYGGVKVSGRNMGFKSNEGSNFFAKNFVQYSLFGGMDFTRYIGAELDVFTTNNKKKSVTIVDGSTALGVPDFSALGDDSYDTKTQLFGGTLQLKVQKEVVSKLKVFAKAGVGLAKLKVKADMTDDDGVPATPTQQANNRIDQSKTNAYFVGGVGLDYRITRNFGARVDVNYENTSRLKMDFQTPGGAPSTYKVRPKDSVVYGLSIYAAV